MTTCNKQIRVKASSSKTVRSQEHQHLRPSDLQRVYRCPGVLLGETAQKIDENKEAPNVQS